jgi:S-DNA-T family DNA segregation ATPase FtsK/SpoIIIE
VRVLTPTDNRRLNELIGFLGVTLAVLVALSLLSYSPRDASLNVSAAPPDAHPARNWIGPVGAHGADILFQGFGYAGFLLPVGLFLLGARWFRSQPVESPVAKVIGYALLLLSLPALLSAGLIAALNSVGAHLVALATFLAALFLTTRFSVTGAHQWLRGPMGKINPFGRLQARWLAWREAREQQRLRKRV